MLRLGLRRLSEVPAAKPAVETVVRPQKKSCSILSRFRSFIGGAVFASAAGMYIITFQLQSLLDEVKSAVHDVAIRQQMIEDRIAKLNQLAAGSETKSE
jgi:hypothetical protein